jgi:hypothetical protein
MTEFGTIIEGTTQPRDLIPAFADCLESFKPSHPAEINVIAEARAIKNCESDTAQEIIGELMDYLNDYAPPYGYFGAHPGDGSDYGFWVSEDVAQEISDNGGAVGSETPNSNTQSGECLVVSDHGNMTLYAWQPNANRITGSHWKEVWSIV